MTAIYICSLYFVHTVLSTHYTLHCLYPPLPTIYTNSGGGWRLYYSGGGWRLYYSGGWRLYYSGGGWRLYYSG